MLVTSVQIASQEGEARIKRIQRAEDYLQKIYEDPVSPQQVIFPETWSTGFFSFDDYKGESEKERGDTYDMMSAWAKKLGSYIHTGSFIEKDGEDYYNTSLLINPQGSVVGKYRKLHLFGFGSRETEILTPGSQITVAQTEFGKVGLATCYDMRFPELFRAMVNLGAQYFLVTAAWPLSRVEHWQIFNKVRAIENQCYLISCNGTGTTDGNQLGGNSMIIDPWGEVIAQGDEHEGIVKCHIDPGKIHENRQNFPALLDKKLI